MKIDLVIQTELSRSTRVRQLEALFDVPPNDKCRLEWHGDLPIDADPWNIGLIVGPSGCGKTSIARQIFGAHFHPELPWNSASVIDDFAKSFSMQDISAVCQAVGFNTIPAWMRPYAVLSNGEKFRVELARRLLELPSPVVLDEFTSVVDRQVAQIGSHAVQKFIRKHNKQFIAVSCHYDIIDWLQPDWILEPATMAFTPRRGLQRRPDLRLTVSRVHRSAWSVFAPFHYLSADLHPTAQCFCLFVDNRPASFAATLHRPHAKVHDIRGISRLVTLPDWQGLGLAMVLCDTLGSAYKATARRTHMYPAHPALVRSFDRSPRWHLEKPPGHFESLKGRSSSISGKFGGRPCAVFSYQGNPMPHADAIRLLASHSDL